MDLFSSVQSDDHRPLADRMRPRTLEDLVGQEEILGEGRLLRRAIEADRVPSLILYGPPGSGKTSLARVIAGLTKAEFVALDAVSSGVADLRKAVSQAKDARAYHGKRTILFVDEIHRFNKGQQDALLPHVEDGTVTLIGATTENPYFEVVSALLSRAQIYRLSPLDAQAMDRLIEMALTEQRGLAKYQATLDPQAREHLIRVAAGDARLALSGLELAVLSTPPDPQGVRLIPLEAIAESIQTPPLAYDKGADQHYDMASAFIKSMRGSDPDAALFYLFRMLEAGEEPRFLARRMVILASEDIGLADPAALPLAVSAFQALEFLGMPEARYALAQAAIYLARAPKSNSTTLALGRAMELVRQFPQAQVPPHLRDAHYRGAENLGHGQGYLYPHDYPGGKVQQQYLPKELLGRRIYRPNPRDKG